MLPVSETLEQFRALDLRHPSFVEAARIISSIDGRMFDAFSFPSNGSLPVVFGGNEIAIKFFPSLYVDEYHVETKALKFLSNCSSPTPSILNQGEIHGWHYVMMSKLSGRSLKELWGNLTTSMRETACFKVGAGLRAIHDMEISEDTYDLRSWDAFLQRQIEGCVARHEKLELREDLIQQIPSFLKSAPLRGERLSFLHTEVMRDHVFFETFEHDAEFCGFIDFEPSMVGAPEYDFASVGIFLSSGDPNLLRTFFRGYGNLEHVANAEFRRRIMAYALLHKYSNLKWYLQFMPNANSLDELADLWWAI